MAGDRASQDFERELAYYSSTCSSTLYLQIESIRTKLTHMNWLRLYTEAIGFWAAFFTTVAFAPQLLQTWRNGGHGLSRTMLTLFGMGVGLWFVYGYLRMSRPIMLANGLTGLQILLILGLKVRHATKASRSELPTSGRSPIVLDPQ